MPEAVIISALETIKALAEMTTEIVRGQTPEQKAKIWGWFIEDVQRVRTWAESMGKP